jgi:hypothetical protein
MSEEFGDYGDFGDIGDFEDFVNINECFENHLINTKNTTFYP